MCANHRREGAWLIESNTCAVRCFLTEHPPRISPAGELDLAAAPVLDRVLDLLFRRPPEDVVIDLSGATFLGVTGLAFLARLHQRLTALGHRATIVEATDHVARTLKRLGLDRLFLIGPSGTAHPDLALAAHDARAPGSAFAPGAELAETVPRVS